MPLPYWPHPSHNLSDDDERSPLRWKITVIHHIMEVLQYDDYDKCSLGFQEVKGYDSAIHLDHMLSLFPKSVLHLIMIPPSSSLASRGSKLYIASAVCIMGPTHLFMLTHDSMEKVCQEFSPDSLYIISNKTQVKRNHFLSHCLP